MHWLTYWTILPWNGKTQYVQSGQFWEKDQNVFYHYNRIGPGYNHEFIDYSTRKQKIYRFINENCCILAIKSLTVFCIVIKNEPFRDTENELEDEIAKHDPWDNGSRFIIHYLDDAIHFWFTIQDDKSLPVQVVSWKGKRQYVHACQCKTQYVHYLAMWVFVKMQNTVCAACQCKTQ